LDHDPAKARGNRRKHGIDLALCGEVFQWPMPTREDPRGCDERRLISLGCVGRDIVVLVRTDRPEGPRFTPAGRPVVMKDKPGSTRSRRTDVPYDPKSKSATHKFWADATPHAGVDGLRAKRGRPAKAAGEKKQQIALRIDKDVLDWYRAQGAGWQTRMNAVLKAYRDATL
jgi:uncharacterized protein (DUF4415 family)/uncharacterized DUF497 family protein